MDSNAHTDIIFSCDPLRQSLVTRGIYEHPGIINHTSYQFKAQIPNISNNYFIRFIIHDWDTIRNESDSIHLENITKNAKNQYRQNQQLQFVLFWFHYVYFVLVRKNKNKISGPHNVHSSFKCLNFQNEERAVFDWGFNVITLMPRLSICTKKAQITKDSIFVRKLFWKMRLIE